MSQKKVYELLKALGGKATLKEISRLAKERYPDASLHQYVYDRLIRLKKWGYVDKNSEGKWVIVEEYPY